MSSGTRSRWRKPPSGSKLGLEQLTDINQLHIYQLLPPIPEKLNEYEVRNKYMIRDGKGCDVYFAIEYGAAGLECLHPECCNQQCIPKWEPVLIRLMDEQQKEVIHIERPYCCLQTMEVQSPPGTVIGYVDQDCSFIYPWFSLKNADEKTILKIKGPLFGCFATKFQILSTKDTKIGEVRKRIRFPLEKVFIKPDSFRASFSMNLDVTAKATILAAAFYIGFEYFENLFEANFTF